MNQIPNSKYEIRNHKLGLPSVASAKVIDSEGAQTRGDGFTLIEIMISLAIMAVLSTIALGYFGESVRTYVKTSRSIHLQNNGNYILTQVEERIRNSSEILSFNNSGTCSQLCNTNWIFLKNPNSTEACYYIGWIPGGAGFGDTGETWPMNGKAFVQTGDAIACSAINPTSLNGTTTAGLNSAQYISNPDDSKPTEGINVTSFGFTVTKKRGFDPATVRIILEVRQGVRGNQSPPLENEKIKLNFSTTTSLR